jgi:hypothetical protein
MRRKVFIHFILDLISPPLSLSAAGQHALKTEQLRVWMLKVPYAAKGNRKNFQFKT